jgi:N12 class adenine-specific DNA methylase/2'-5' RNA ligase
MTPEDQLNPQREMSLPEFIDLAGDKLGVPKPLRDAIFQNESNFNHYWDNGKVKRSPKGAIGVGQLMPATAKKWKVDPENPIDNAYGALQEQKELYEKYLGSTGDANQAALLTAAAYNAGPGAVDKYGTIPPYHETQEYVRKVAAHLKRNPITQNVLSQSPAPVTARPAAAPPVPEELGPEGRQKTEQLPTRQTIAPPPPPPVAMPDPFAMQSVKAAESTVYPAGNTLASNTPASNTRWAKPGPYTTTLSPQEETAFQAWVKANKIPWQDVPESDYDMRGYFHALQTGDSSARTAQSKFDGKPHFPDTYKTPFHKTFSNESKYALPNAPHWQQDRLVDEQGNVVADETPKQPTRRTAPSAADLIVRTAVRNPDKLAADLRWHFGMNDPGDLRRLPVATQRRMIAMATTAAAADDRKRQEGENIEPSLEYQNQMRAKVGLGPNPALIDPRVAKPGLTKFHFNPQTPQEQLKESLGPLKTGPAPAVLSAPGADDDIRKQIRAQVVAERDARQKGPMTQARAGLAMADTAQRGTAIEDEVQRRLDDYKRAQATPREQDLAKQEIQRLEGQNYFARLWNQPTVESLVHKATATVSRDISHVLPAGAAKRLNELAESEQSQARIDDMVQNYGYAGNRGVLRRIGAESSRMAFNLGPQILVAETGIPFPLIAAGTSYLENGDKTPTERLEAAGAAYILAQAYTKGPAAAVSGLARISPRISRLAAEYPEITSRVTGGTLFGAAGGIEAAAKGGNREDIAVGAATGALPGIALGSGKRLAEEFGRIPESAIKAEWLPEPVRTAVARAKGYQPVIVQTDEASPRFASVYYKSPREQFVQEISPEQAAEFNRAAKGEKARPFITVNGADFDRVADFSTSNEGPKSATTEPAPINRQLEQDSPKAGNKITSKEGVSESANKISANPTIEAPPKTSENQPGRTDETLKENAPQSGATGATGPAAEAQVSAEAVRATGDIPDDNSLPGDVRGVPPVEGQPLGRITPKQIVRHSDPNIDGGEVVGRAPDGRLKVQNKEGGVSLVQDPRRQGNREAAIVKAEEPKEAEIVKEPDYTGETEAPITYQGRSWRPTVSMARTDDGEWKISGVKLHDDTTGEYKQILSSGGDQTFPTAEAAHEYALTQTRRVLGEKLPEPKTQRALPETATEPWPVRRAKNDVEVVNDSGGNLGPLQDAQHVADVYDKRGQLAYHLVTGRDAEGPILAKVPTENHPNETTEYVDNAMSVQQYMDDARSEGEDVRLVSQPKSITPTAAAKPSPNSIPSSSIFQSPTKAQDRAVYRGKKFWIGTVSTLDGEIENVYSRKEAEDYGAKHERYMRPADVDGINSGDRAMFWVDKNGEVQSEWRNGALSPELKQRIESQIERLGTQTPSAGPSAEVVTPPTPAEEGAKGAAETPSTPNESLESKPGEKHPETGRKFSSTQVNLPATEAKRVKGEGQRLIPDSALAADGREEDPHITVKYGLHTENADAVRELLADEPPVKVKIGKTSIFAAKEGADYDVVKLDVDSPDLHRLNAEIAKYLKVTDTHPEYKPHITLAYVKPGLGKRYEGRTLPDLTGKEITLDKVLFSSRNGDEVEIPLGGEVPTSKLQMGANGTYQKDQPGVETVSYPRTKAEKVSADVHVLDTGEGWVYGVDVELAREGNGRPMFGEPKETTREEALRAGLEEVYRTAHSEANNSQASEKQQAQAAKVMNWAAQQYNDLAPAEDTSTNKEVPENDQQQSTGLAKRPVENAPEEGVGGSAPSSTESDLDVNRPFRKRKYEETPLDAKTLALFRAKKAAEVGAHFKELNADGPKHITLIACGATKLDHAAPAKLLYSGDLFQKSKAYAEQHTDGFFILSAQHGLVKPDQVLEPYDKTLQNMNVRERAGWGAQVFKDAVWNIPSGSRITLLAGNDYAAHIESRLKAAGFTVDRPLQGLGIGQQKQKLIEMTKTEDRPIKRLPVDVERVNLTDSDLDEIFSKPSDESQIVNPIDRNATQEEKVRQLVALSKENAPIIQRVMDRIDSTLGTESTLSFKKTQNILGKANRPSIKDAKPWFDVEHVRDSLRFKTKLETLEDIETVANIVRDEGLGIVKIDSSKMVTPREWGWRFVAFDLRMPNGQLVEYYAPLKELDAPEVKDVNHTLFEKWRGKTSEELLANYAEYQKDVKDSYQRYQRAWDSALERLGLDERAAEASWNSISARLGSETTVKSSLSSSAVGTRTAQEPSADLTPGGTPVEGSGITQTRPVAESSETSAETLGSRRSNESAIGETSTQSIRQEGANVPAASSRILPALKGQLEAVKKRIREANIADLGGANNAVVAPLQRKRDQLQARIDAIEGQAPATVPSPAPTPAPKPPKQLTRDEERRLKFLDKELKQLRGGMDVAYDVAMNDGGASLKRLEAKIEKLEANRAALLGIDSAPVQEENAANELPQGTSSEAGVSATDQLGAAGEGPLAEVPAGAVSGAEGIAGPESSAAVSSGPSEGSIRAAGESGNAAIASGGTGAEDVHLPASGSGPGDQPERVSEPVDHTVTAADDAASKPQTNEQIIDGAEARAEENDPDSGKSHALSLVGDFYVEDVDSFSAGSLKQKYQRNIDAIVTLRRIQAEGRDRATPEEQATMARFIGWGQFPGLFNERTAAGEQWAEERQALKALLSPEEFRSARGSILNAHYTAPQIVKAMWDIARRLGFRRGRVLEPSMGSGNFFALMPRDIRKHSPIVGIELDKTTGAIAQLLYPNADVQVKGYEEYNVSDDFFDLITSNFPFGDYQVADARYPQKLKSQIHDYFFVKSIDKVRPGGIVLGITSTGTMDKGSQAVRAHLAEKADLIAAIRLPSNTFLKEAGTAVVTDIIILRKRVPGEEVTPELQKIRDNKWLELKEVPDPLGHGPIPVNEYFADHPEMIIGRLDRSGELYREHQKGVTRLDNFEDHFQTAISSIPQSLFRTRVKTKAFEPQMLSAPDEVKQGSFTVQDGKIYQRVGAHLIEQSLSPETVKRVTALLGIRDVENRLFHAELNDPENADAIRKELNKTYDAFVKQHGYISEPANLKPIADDPDRYRLLALERRDPETKKVTKSDIFTTATLSRFLPATSAKGLVDATSISLNERGAIDLDRIAELLSTTAHQVGEDLVKQGIAYNDPRSGWVSRGEYLTGRVRQKLLEAREAARTDPSFKPNVEALEAAQPEDRPYSKIQARLGATWIPPSDVAQFMADQMSASPSSFSVRYSNTTGTWAVSFSDSGSSLWSSQKNREELGTPDRSYPEIIEAAITDKPIQIRRTASDGSTWLDRKASAAAMQRVKKARKSFERWIWQDDERRERLHRKYNDLLNDTVPLRVDGSHQTFPGMNPVIAGEWMSGTRKHQPNAVYRAVTRGLALFAHEVGTGKTFSMVATAMERRRLGLSRKPCIACLNSNVAQVTDAAHFLYPNARILAAHEGMDPDKRQKTVTQIATGDWDIVILTHDNLDLIPMSAETQEVFIRKELEELEAAVDEARRQNPDGKKDQAGNRIVKQLEKKLKDREAALKNIIEKPKDPAITFEETGIDFLMVDEAHKFKALPIYTARGNVKGIPTSKSDRATNMYMRTQWLLERNNGQGVVFATGTPISNTMAELFNMQRFLQRADLEVRGIDKFDGWAAVFGETTAKHEFKPTGDWQVTTRFNKFTNLPQLAQLAGEVIDVAFAKDIPGIDRPKRDDDVVTVPMSPDQKSYLDVIRRRAAALGLAKGPPQKGDDNWLVLFNDAKKAAIDMRLIDRNYEDDPESKLNRMVRDTLEFAKAKENKGKTQLLFSDMGVNPSPNGISLYADIIKKLVKGGMKRDQIIDFSKFEPGNKGHQKAKAEAMDKLWRGIAKVGIGGTEKLGTGVNAQKKLAVLRHLDAPPRPSDIEQRDGRGWRDGNENKTIKILRYTTEGSFDVNAWQVLDGKNTFIRQFLEAMSTGAGIPDTFEDEDDEFNYARVMAVTSGNPLLMKKMDAERELAEMESDYEVFHDTQLRARDRVAQWRRSIAWNQERMQTAEKDMPVYKASVKRLKDMGDEEAEIEPPPTKIGAATKAFRKSIATHIKAIEDNWTLTRHMREEGVSEPFAKYRGFDVVLTQQAQQTFGEQQGTKYDYVPALVGPSGYQYRVNWAMARPGAVFDQIDGDLSNLERVVTNSRESIASSEAAIKEASSLTEGAYPEQEALDAKRREVDVLTQQLTAAGGALPLPEDYSDLSTRYLDTGKLKQDERPIEMLGKDEEWQTNTIDGKPAFTNGKFILIGEPTGPHTESYSPESMKRVLNTGASATEGERVAPFAIEDLTNTVLLTNGVRLDLGYLDLILDHYPNARLRYAEGKPNSMLSIVDGKKLVGALIVGKAKPLDKEFQAAANIALQRAAAKDARLDEVEQLIRPMRGPARRTERPRVTADQAVGEAQPHAAREVKRPKWMSGPTEMHAGMPFLRSLFSPKSRNVGVNVPPTASDFADVEERWTAAKGIKVPGGLAKATEALRTFFRSFKRHYIHLDPNQGPQSALTSDILRLHEASPAWAKAMAYDHLVEITGDLNDKAVDVLTRNLVLPDILKDIDEGLYEDPDSGELRELPFGYKSREQVEQDLTKFEKLADANPEIKAAIDRRKQITGAITRRLVDLDLLNPDVLKDDRYYHRQVLKYVNAQDFVSTGTGGGVRLSRKGFQKERAGGGDFNVRYQEAEFEWLSQAYSLIAKQETLDQLDKVNNIIDDLKRQAKTLNSQAMQKSLIARDELDGFRSRIGRANAELKEMAKNGDLSSANGRYDNLINQLAATPQKQPFNHPDWFAFLSHLLENDLNGKLQAAMIFKAIAQREKYTREFLGKDYKTWQDLVPDTHAIWQPEKGNLFFMASTVEEKALAQVLAGDRALESSDVKNQMVFGGKKAQWVMPKEVVQTLEGMTSLPSADPVEDLWVLAQNTWKQWVLLNPTRAVVYNFNNMSGDLDIALAYDPRILKKFKQAAADLWRFQVTHKASPALKADLLKAIKLGVVDSGLTITEIPDINKAGAFRALVEEDQNILARGVQSYWDGIKNFTSWRENILRLAAFRHFKENGGYGASNPDQINAIKDSDERAAKLARELIGDYGNVSVAGQWIRRHLIPFYSWIEINAPRYAQLLKNTARETGSKGKSGRVRFGAVTAKKVALLLLKAHALLALITLWNHLRFPEEEKELRREGRKPHIILGRAPDGSIRTLKFQGALADALEWFGFDDWPSDVADLLSGRKDWKDEVAETVKAPAERVVNSLEPFSKSVFELATGRQLYPHFFKEGSSFGLASRPIRDRKEYVARVFSLGALYNRVTGKPVRPFGSDPVWGALESFLVYRTDPGEAAYWEIRGRLAEWQEAHGRAQESGGEPTERQNALYYFKQASKWGDDDAAKKWLDKYRELGGTDKGLKASIRVAHPLGSLARKDWDEFAKGLTPEEKIMLRQSIDWYKKTYGDIPEEDDSTLQEEVDRIMSGERGGSRRSHRTGGRPHHHQKQGEFQIPADQ